MISFHLKILTILGLLSAEASHIVKFPGDFENDNEIVEKLEEKSVNPVVLLIEDHSKSFSSANAFVNSVLSDKLNFWIVKFNATGVSQVLEVSKNNIENFKRTLNELTIANYFTEDSSNKSLPFFGMLHVAQILSKNSTIVVFCDGKNVDDNLAQLAFNAVSLKNITVHLYRNNSKSKINNFLKDISRLSGGQIFSNQNSEANYGNYKDLVYENNLSGRINILLTRRNQKGTNNIRLPVDSDITGIYVSVVPWDDSTIMLTSPTGFSMKFSDENNTDAARKYSYASFFERQGDSFEIYLNFINSPRPSVGFWSVKVANLKRTYNVTVYGLTNITTQAFVRAKNGENKFPNQKSKEVIKIGLSGAVNTTSDIIFVESDGYSVLESFALRNSDGLSTDTKELNVEIGNDSNIKPSYALVKGIDIKGHVFERLGYIFGFNKRNLYPQETLTVDVGVGSQLFVVPGAQAQVYFEVTNRGNDVINTFFSASDTRWILQSLSAHRRVLNPQESYIVTLILTRQARSGTYQDEITFTAKGGGQIVQKKAIIDVGATQNYYDRSEPSLDYSYTSDCTEVVFKKCEQGTWTIEVTAQDTDSGIIQVNSVPKGLYFPTSYTAGTLDRVVGYYSDSCCNPDLQIVAVDRANNRRSYNVNAYHAVWSPGAIAALVLGILLFILLIALIVYLIRRCRGRKETFDLPTYRGGDI